MLRTSMKRLMAMAVVTAPIAPCSRAQSFSDSFDDNAPSTYWQVVEAVDAVSIAEVGGKLEFTTTADPAQTSKKFAGYLAQNWHMRTTGNFFMRVAVRNDTSGVTATNGSMQSLSWGFFKAGEATDTNGFPGSSRMMELGARRVASNGGTPTLYRWVDFIRYSTSGETQISTPRYAFPDAASTFYSASSGIFAFDMPTTQTVFMRYTTNDDTLSISLVGYNGPYIALLTNFTSGQKYPVGIALGGYGKLQGVVASGEATYDNLVVDSASIDAAAPNFAASDGTTGDKVVLTWTTAPGATGYKVLRTPNAGGATVELVSGLSATAVSYWDLTADRLVEYTYAVQTLTAPSGDVEYQATDTGWRNIDVPTGVAASDSTFDDRIRVDWKPVQGAIGYEIHRAIGTSASVLVGTVDGATSQFDDMTAVLGVTYAFSVSAVSPLGTTAASAPDLGTRGLPIDADGDSIPDSIDNCALPNPNQADCNANGIGDVCDIASGKSLDCDQDDLPDECEGAVVVSLESELLPLSAASPATVVFDDLHRAYGRAPKLIVEATADLGAPNDGLLLTLDGVNSGALFVTDGLDCPASPDLATLTIELPNFNAFVADRSLAVRASVFGSVASDDCAAGGGVRFRLVYYGLPTAADCDGNGQLDSCEIGTGTAPDCNSNGKPDSCDISSGFSADCNSNGRPDSCDIAIGSSSDLNANGIPDDCGELVVGGTGYATIAAAVAAAPSGATIRVAPGTYSGTVVLDSKPITIQSFGGAAVTTISGVGATNSMLAIRTAAANGCVIDGFTLRDGSAGTAAYGVRVGGAMFLENTTATIRNCRFISNSTEYGGGIYGLGFSGVIEDCLFQGNTAQFNSGGVQLGFGGTCVFRRNTIRQNTAQNGGGMHLVNWFEGAVTNVSLSDCVFEQNTATAEGGALYWYGSVGQNLAVERCIVLDNSATDGAFVRVGGALAFAMSNSRFCRNAPVDVVGSIVNLGGNGFGTDCNGNGICDGDELVAGTATDCNNNGVLDSCDLVAGTAFDCNANGIVDSCDIASGISGDVDSNGIPDDCKPDCDGDDIPDAWEIQTGQARDCDSDGVPDNCEITQDPGKDKNANGRLDSCELARGDLNLDGFVNAADLTVLLAFWGIPQPPVGDLNGDGIVAGADVTILLSNWGTTP